MTSSFRKTAAILLACLTLSAALFAAAPAAYAGSVKPLVYNAHDVAKLTEFFSYTNYMNISNGVTVHGSDYNANDPSTWTCCTWTSSGRLNTIEIDSLGVIGVLDLSGCAELTAVDVHWGMITGAVVTGCPKLVSLIIDGNDDIKQIDTSENPLLEVLNVGANDISSLSLENNPLLKVLRCKENALSTLELSCCPLLEKLDAASNILAEINVACCPNLVELSLQNNLLEALDISNCPSLYILRCSGNLLTSVELSCFNGGESYSMTAIGNGYVGTRCVYINGGWTLVAQAKPREGETFLGWYVNDVLQPVYGSNALESLIPFDGESQIEARFTTAVTPVVLGDVDGDDDVDTVDALLLMRYTLGIFAATDQLLAAGDYNGDGAINTADALLILQSIL